VAPISRPVAPSTTPNTDAESRALLRRLQAEGAEHEQALTELRDLLLKAARFEVRRRSSALPHLRGGDGEDLAQQSADDALVAVLAKLDDFRGDSRFTTWAYKFALLEAAVKLRRRAWQGRELPVEPEHWSVIADSAPSPVADAEQRALLEQVQESIKAELSPHQREVLLAVAVNGVPIDVMAERLNTTRGALYKTIHDARKKLRAGLDSAGFELESREEVGRR
jgi:RNA polymerase sigma-70 factor (ECF subfamily)